MLEWRLGGSSHYLIPNFIWWLSLSSGVGGCYWSRAVPSTRVLWGPRDPALQNSVA